MKKINRKKYVGSIVATVLTTALILIGSFAGATNLLAKASKVEGRTVAPKTNLAPVSIYDEENLLRISIEDVGKYHGDISFCAVVGFRATQFAIAQLWKDEIPKRKDFKIISAFPGKGSQDAFEFITRAKTRKDFNLKLPEGTSPQNLSIDNLVFTFTRKSTGKQIKIWVKEEIFPIGYKEFFNLRKKAKFDKMATPKEKKAFKLAKQELKEIVMSLPVDSLFGFQKNQAGKND